MSSTSIRPACHNVNIVPIGCDLSLSDCRPNTAVMLLLQVQVINMRSLDRCAAGVSLAEMSPGLPSGRGFAREVELDEN
jgi:hypothetical protein